MAEEKRQFEMLRRKWGSKIVRYDKNDRSHKKVKKEFDYNPVIKVGIKGV